jgi:Na+-transporting NADH:ubiquinone oxidoreductase subunit NqrF
MPPVVPVFGKYILEGARRELMDELVSNHEVAQNERSSIFPQYKEAVSTRSNHLWIVARSRRNMVL